MTHTDSTPMEAATRSANSAPRSRPTLGLHEALAVIVRAATKQVDEAQLSPVVLPAAGSVFHPRPLLTLLTYCYSRQIYSSAEICDRITRDQALRQLCQDELPSAEILRHFRRRHREVLCSCLMAALCFLASQKVAIGYVTKVDSRHLAEEARRRVIMAAFLDDLAIDRQTGGARDRPETR